MESNIIEEEESIEQEQNRIKSRIDREQCSQIHTQSIFNSSSSINKKKKKKKKYAGSFYKAAGSPDQQQNPIMINRIRIDYFYRLITLIIYIFYQIRGFSII